MPSWNELTSQLDKQPQELASQWLIDQVFATLKAVSTLRSDRNVIFYASAFLQKPAAPPPTIQITSEDLNGLMSVLHGMDCGKGLTLLLHTPGGVTNAAETIVAYLRSKFADIEVAVPTFAMSAGTMISLAANRIIMGRQSQLGPIDPQFVSSTRAFSARAVVDQFEAAKKDILADTKAAHAWAPILQAMGPSLVQEAENALKYGENMVAEWLEKWMFAGQANAKEKARRIAEHFNAAHLHKSHGRRIDRDEARGQGVVIEDLETDQQLQDAVLTAYHLVTIAIEKGPAAKLMISDAKKMYVKNLPEAPAPILPFPIPQMIAPKKA
jgi:ClpP class serine protease